MLSPTELQETLSAKFNYKEITEEATSIFEIKDKELHAFLTLPISPFFTTIFKDIGMPTVLQAGDPLSQNMVTNDLGTQNFKGDEVEGATIVINIYDYVTIATDMFKVMTKTGLRYKYDKNMFNDAISFFCQLNKIQIDDSGRYLLHGSIDRDIYQGFLNCAGFLIKDLLLSYLVLLSSRTYDNSVNIRVTIPWLYKMYIHQGSVPYTTALDKWLPAEKYSNSELYSNRINFLPKKEILKNKEQYINSVEVAKELQRLFQEDPQLVYRLDLCKLVSILRNPNHPNHDQLSTLLICNKMVRSENIIIFEEF